MSTTDVADKCPLEPVPGIMGPTYTPVPIDAGETLVWEDGEYARR